MGKSNPNRINDNPYNSNHNKDEMTTQDKIEALKAIRDEFYFPTSGLCRAIESAYLRRAISEGQYKYLKALVEKKRKKAGLGKVDFFWVAYDDKPRLKWIDKKIRKLEKKLSECLSECTLTEKEIKPKTIRITKRIYAGTTSGEKEKEIAELLVRLEELGMEYQGNVCDAREGYIEQWYHITY